MSSPLILDSNLVKLFSTANRIVAFQEAERHWLRVFPTDDYDRMFEIGIFGSVHGHYNPHAGQKSACHIPYTGRNIFKLLKTGDSLSLTWWPDNGSPMSRKAGIMRQSLMLGINRKRGKHEEYIELKLADEICSYAFPSMMMCQGYPIKEDGQHLMAAS